MKVIVKWLVSGFLCLTLLACGGSGSSQVKPVDPPPPPPSRIDVLWPNTISSYLADELWQPQYNYDAAHLLTLPLYYAYKLDQSQEKKQQFESFFTKYEQQLEASLDTNIQRRFFFFFLTSNFLHWCDCKGTLADSLITKLVAQTEHVWGSVKTRTWGFADFDNYKASVEWKLAGGPGGTVDYGLAFFDDELNILATGARLKAVLAQYGKETNATMDEISAIAARVFVEKGVHQADGGWLFQPGVWANYEDYKFAGHQVTAVGLEAKPIAGIATDSSHIARIPLWLDAITSAATDDGIKQQLSRIKAGFERQLLSKVLITASSDFNAPRLKNYFSGENGLYRYNFSGFQAGDAYEAYELSGAFISNWYPFLKSQQLAGHYKSLSQSFPLATNITELYTGPVFDRSGAHPLIRFPGYFNNGFAELYTLIAKDM